MVRFKFQGNSCSEKRLLNNFFELKQEFYVVKPLKVFCLFS